MNTANMTATTVGEKFKQYNSKTGAETAAACKKTMTAQSQKPKQKLHQSDVAGGECCEQCGVELRSDFGFRIEDFGPKIRAELRVRVQQQVHRVQVPNQD